MTNVSFKKVFLFLLCLGLCCCVSFSVEALSGDDPLPGTMTNIGYTYVIFLPDSEEYNSTGNTLCLNLFSNLYPANYTKITKAPYTNNGTQWFCRLTYNISGSKIYAWATYNDLSYSLNCSRYNTTGYYCNVFLIEDNAINDLNIHSPACFTLGESEYFLSAPPRLMQNIMLINKTAESTGYTNHTYLVWRTDANQYPDGSGYSNENAQHAFIFWKSAYPSSSSADAFYIFPGYCIHGFNDIPGLTSNSN